MDKYEFNIKVEQIKKLVNKSDFDTAMKIADTIDWRRVRNANLLALIAQIYEKNAEYQEAKEILLLAFERAPSSKRLLCKLSELAIKQGSIKEAEDYYREFCDLAPEDPRQHLLRYMILKEKNAPAEQLIHSLERYTDTELDEKWLYELAELYGQAGNKVDCVKTCDRIMLMFGLGKYVDKAMELKVQYAPLSSYQKDLVENRDKYEERLRAVEQSFSGEAGSLQEEYEDSGEPEEMEHSTLDEEIAVSFHQAEMEAQLAKEMSRISVEEFSEPETPAQQTKILSDLKQITSTPYILRPEPFFVPEPEDETLNEECEDETVTIEDAEESYTEAAPGELTAQLNEEEEPEEQAKENPNIEEPKEESMMAEEEIPEVDSEALCLIKNHFMVEARTPEAGLAIAVDALKKIYKKTGVKNQVVKISGEKLNQKGVFACADKLAGKNLIIEDAGDLSETAMEELKQLLMNDHTGVIAVLIDNPRQVEELHRRNPGFCGLFECIGTEEDRQLSRPDMPDAVMEAEKSEPSEPEAESEEPEAPQTIAKAAPAEPAWTRDEEMDLDDFAEYACKYASDIDCSITGKSMLALYERIEIMEEDGIPLTRENAEDLIEEAADRAEKPPLVKRIAGVFSSKYDKDGLLILKEGHFI